MSHWRMFRLRTLRWSQVNRTLNRLYHDYVILPHVCARADLRRILLVGVARYTTHYLEFFPSERELHTLDRAPEASRYGAGDRHHAASVEDLGERFPAGSFDCVLMNGVYGWGLDDEKALRRSLDAIGGVLRTNGLFVFGWDTAPQHDPCRLDEGSYFGGFRRYRGLGGSRAMIPRRFHWHVFDFYEKP